MQNIHIDKIIRSKRNSITMTVRVDGSLVVRAPRRCSLTDIRKTVDKNGDWVLRSRQKIKEKYHQVQPKQYQPGEKFLFLGEMYELAVTHDSYVPLRFEDNRFILAAGCVPEAHDVFQQWYKQAALRILTERAEVYAPIVGVKFASLRITSARMRWGSCNAKGNICFSLRLVMAPLPVIDYVVVHELVHIKERNHSPGFWDKVKAIIPDYKDHRNWLRKNQNLLSF